MQKKRILLSFVFVGLIASAAALCACDMCQGGIKGMQPVSLSPNLYIYKIIYFQFTRTLQTVALARGFEHYAICWSFFTGAKRDSIIYHEHKEKIKETIQGLQSVSNPRIMKENNEVARSLYSTGVRRYTALKVLCGKDEQREYGIDLEAFEEAGIIII